ncbi:MAG: hypothetical protein AAF228_13585, partial [Pseudomonadota bacterium]
DEFPSDAPSLFMIDGLFEFNETNSDAANQVITHIGLNNADSVGALLYDIDTYYPDDPERNVADLLSYATTNDDAVAVGQILGAYGQIEANESQTERRQLLDGNAINIGVGIAAILYAVVRNYVNPQRPVYVIPPAIISAVYKKLPSVSLQDLLSLFSSQEKNDIEEAMKDPWTAYDYDLFDAAADHMKDLTGKEIVDKIKDDKGEISTIKSDKTVEILKLLRETDPYLAAFQFDAVFKEDREVAKALILSASANLDDYLLVSEWLGKLSYTGLALALNTMETELRGNFNNYPALTLALESLSSDKSAAGFAAMNNPSFSKYLIEKLDDTAVPRVLDAMVRLNHSIWKGIVTTFREASARIMKLFRNDKQEIIIPYMTYEAAAKMLLAHDKTDGTQIIAQDDTLGILNAIDLGDEATPLLVEMYTKGGNHGQTTVNQFLGQSDIDLATVYLNDRANDLTTALYNQLGTVTTPFSPDIGIIPDADLASYDEEFAIQLLGGGFVKGTGKLYNNGETVALINVSGNSNFNQGQRAAIWTMVNGRGAFVIVDPDAGYTPIVDDDNNVLVAIPKPKSDTPDWKLLSVPAQEIQTADGAKLDISQDFGGIFALPQKADGTPYTFEAYQTVLELDEQLKLSLGPSEYSTPSKPGIFDFPGLYAEPNIELLNTAPNPLVEIRQILQDIRDSGGLDTATDQQVVLLYNLVANLGWRDPDLPSMLTTDERGFILKIFIQTQRQIEGQNFNLERAMGSYDIAVLKHLSTVDSRSAPLPSEMRPFADQMASEIITVLENDVVIKDAIQNWKNLGFEERKRLVRIIVAKVKSAFGIQDNINIEFDDTMTDTKLTVYYSNFSKMTFSSKYIQSNNIVASILSRISFGLFDISKLLKLSQYKNNTLSADQAFLEGSLLLYHATQNYQNMIQKGGLQITNSDIINSYSFRENNYLDGIVGAHFANRFKDYYQKLFEYQFSTTIPAANVSRLEDSASNNNIYIASFFIDIESYTLKYGVWNLFGSPLWSTEIYDLAKSKIVSVGSAHDSEGNWVTNVVASNPIDNQTVRIFPDKDIPAGMDSSTGQFYVMDDGRFIMTMLNSAGERVNVIETDPDIPLRQNLGNTLELDLSSDPNAQVMMSPDQFMQSENKNSGYGIFYNEKTDTIGRREDIAISSNGSFGNLVLDKDGYRYVDGDGNKTTKISAQPGHTVHKLVLENDGFLVLYDTNNTEIGRI